jgi:uncharacterized membrane-anchored protein
MFTSDQETDWVIDTTGLASPRVCSSHFDTQVMNMWQVAVLLALIIYIWSSNQETSIDLTWNNTSVKYLYYETHC